MARLRLCAIVAIVLVLFGCSLLKPPENSISFTLNGIQYLFTESAGLSDRPYAVGYTQEGQEVPYRYAIRGSATAADAADGTNTFNMNIFSRGDWGISAYLVMNDLQTEIWFTIDPVPAAWIDTFITNRDDVGRQFTASMPGPFSDSSAAYTLENVVISVERLPNKVSPQPQ